MKLSGREIESLDALVAAREALGLPSGPDTAGSRARPIPFADLLAERRARLGGRAA